MKTRTLSIACLTAAATLMAACTAVYKNTDACEQLMRSKLAEKSPDTLKIAHTGTAIHGSRVVVEGAIDHLLTASEVAAAAAAAPKTAVTATGAGAKSKVAGAAGATGASGATAAMPASAASADSATLAASAPRSASAGSALSLFDKSGKRKKITLPAAAECQFHGETLDVFSWLAPAKYATPADTAANETSD